MLILVAIDGASLLRPTASAARSERERVRDAVHAACLLGHHHDLVVTHGSSLPHASQTRPTLPVDVEGAQTQGMYGYYLAQAFTNALPEVRVVSFITQTEIAAHRVAPTTVAATVTRPDLAASRLDLDEPLRVLEMRTIQQLVDVGTLVVCAGGGSIAVARDEWGRLEPTGTVVSHEHLAAHLAEELDADALLFLGSHDHIPEGGHDVHGRLPRGTSTHLQGLKLTDPSLQITLAIGCAFTSRTGKPTMIGQLGEASRVLSGERGTTIYAE